MQKAKDPVWVQWDEANACWRDVSGNPVDIPANRIEASQISHADLGGILGMTKSGRELKEPDFQKALGKLLKLQGREARSGTPDYILASFLARVLAVFEVTTSHRDFHKAQEVPDDGIETNFNFYVDGYTLASTGVEGEVLVTRYDGASCVLKSKSLTNYFDRRLDDRVLARAV